MTGSPKKRQRFGQPGYELPPEIKKLQDPNFTREDFLAVVRKVAKAPPKAERR